MVLTAVQKKETMDLLCQKLFDQRLVRGIRQNQPCIRFMSKERKNKTKKFFYSWKSKIPIIKKLFQTVQ